MAMIAGLMLTAAAQPPAQPSRPIPPPKRTAPAERAKADLGSLIGMDDYPADALRGDEEGTVGFRLDVGPDGRVTGCAITASSGSGSLDSATCRLLTERARFTPARDSKGAAIADSLDSRILWRIDRSMSVDRGLVVYAATIGPAGETSCRQGEDGAPLEPAPCHETFEELKEMARAGGKPIEHLMIITTTPEGEEEPAYPGDHGMPYLATEVLLTIAADGSRFECRIVRNESPHATEPPPDPCGAFGPDTRFEPAAKGSKPRLLTVRSRGFVRF